MGEMQFLLADDIHLTEARYRPLIRHIRERRIPADVHTEHPELKLCAGDYAKAERLGPYRKRLEALSPEALWSFTHAYRSYPLRLFPLVKSEALAFALGARAHWHEEPVPVDERSVFDRMVARDKETLLGNMAAAMFWIDAFSGFFAARPYVYSHGFVAGGCALYQRVLMDMLRLHGTRVFVLGHTFASGHFFCEERATPLGNDSELGLPNVRAAIHLTTEPFGRMRDRASVITRVLKAMRSQSAPPVASGIRRGAPTKTVVVLGQPVEDPALLERATGSVSSISVYREIIARLLKDTDYHVMFATLASDRFSTLRRDSVTRAMLERFAQGLPSAERARLSLRSDGTVEELAKLAEGVVLLSSQAGLEFAFLGGVKPYTLARPYYADAGFSTDLGSVDELLEDLRSHGLRPPLTMDEYESLLDFLRKLLLHHAVPDYADGVRKLDVVLSERGVPARAKATLPSVKPKPQPTKPTSTKLGGLLRKTQKLVRNPRAFLLDAKLP